MGEPQGTETESLWQAFRLRMKRRALIARAIRKRRELRNLSDRTRSIPPAAIIAAMVVRNEASRLPYFLDHHRRLGVSHFLIIDNGSNDGTVELLRDQPDVSLWQTSGSYKKSRFGLDWLNWILLRHARNRWVLVLDADELLIYPYHETRPLPALVQWLEGQGLRAMPAMMLDLYPEHRLSASDHKPGMDPTDLLTHFDSGNYGIKLQPKLRSLWIQGGVRARMFFDSDPRRAPTLTKIPLVKWHWRYVWLNSTHSLLPAKLNQCYDTEGGERTSGILLHTKFLPEIVSKSAEEKERRQHFADPARYEEYYEQVIADPKLICAHSTRLRGWRHLEALGLMSRGGWI